jgi:hypothetical protein
MSAWRDVDHDRPRLGFSVWKGGGEVSLGRRLYRWRWGSSGTETAVGGCPADTRGDR